MFCYYNIKPIIYVVEAHPNKNNLKKYSSTTPINIIINYLQFLENNVIGNIIELTKCIYILL